MAALVRMPDRVVALRRFVPERDLRAREEELRDLVASTLREAAQSDTRRRRIVALMIAVTRVNIVGTTVHLPATPAMADNLGGDIATVQGFPTAYLIASASGQLVLGPLSDAVGRRRLLLPDLGGFAGGPAREGGAVPGVAVPTVWPYRLEIRPGAPPPTAPVRAGRRGSARRRSRDSCPS
jgi:hypothetical protein